MLKKLQYKIIGNEPILAWAIACRYLCLYSLVMKRLRWRIRLICDYRGLPINRNRRLNIRLFIRLLHASHAVFPDCGYELLTTLCALHFLEGQVTRHSVCV